MAKKIQGSTIGKNFETLAAMYLKSIGYKIIETNYRYNKAEIDIVSEHENTLVFTEVKARRSERFGQPEDFVDENKEQRIREAAEKYQEVHNWHGKIRFDVISILFGDKNEIQLFEDAF